MRHQQLQIADCRLQIAKSAGATECHVCPEFFKSAICNLQSAISRSGFTLIELLTVMMVIGFLFATIASTILGTLKIEKAEAAAYHRLVAQHALADRFRADVTGAGAAPEKWQDWVKGPTCLILKTSDAGHIVYHWHDGKLERIESAGKKLEKQFLPLGEKKLTVEFAGGTESPKVLTMRVKGPVSRQPVEISAALGGNRK